jgi:hypothetical protein
MMGETETVKRRYANFARLHRVLKKKFPRSDIPALPNKRLLGRSFKEKYIQKKVREK